MNAPLQADLLQSAVPYRRRYVSIRAKFAIALTVALLWTAFSVRVASAWLNDLSELTNPFLALWTLTFVAFVPGFMNAFLATSLVLDKRPARRIPSAYPGVTLLIAAYNEEVGLAATLESIADLNYVGPVEALVFAKPTSRYGAQRATGSGWASARLAEVRFESPRGQRGFRAFGHVQYSNNSLTGSGNYDYVMARVGVTKAF